MLKALYAAASNPDLHEDFVEQFDLAFESSDKAEFREWLEPHVESATTIFEKLSYANLLEKSADGLLQHFTEPSAIVSGDGEVIASNRAWEEIGPAARLMEISDLAADREALQSAVQSLHAILEDRTKIIRLRDAPPNMSILTFRRLPIVDARHTNGGTVLVRGLGIHWSDLLTGFLQEQFSLSGAELLTLKRIVEGQTLAEIADDIDRGRETVKSHAKSVYAKMRVSGREPLVKLVLQLQNLLGANADRAFLPEHVGEPGYFITLESGQRLYCEEKGAKSGRRILFLHGLSLGHHFSEGFERQLAKAGLTLVCVERPGYGRSNPPQNWRKGLEEWIDLFPDVMRKLDLARSPIVTQTGGVMLATAVAAHHPNLVSGICAFAAGIPITDRHNLSQYPPQIRIISRAARLSPSVLRFILTNGTQYFRTPEGRDRIIDRSYATSPVDREALEDSKTRDRVRASIQMIADGGFDGFISDNLHMFGDWSRFPSRVRCEIAYFNGSEDPVCPIEWSREFAQTINTMSVAEVAGAGNLMLHTHPEQCVAHLLGCLERFDQESD